MFKLFTGTLVASDERVQVGLEELQDLKGVWSELAKIWEKVDELKEKPWLSIQPRKVGVALLLATGLYCPKVPFLHITLCLFWQLRQSLDALLNDMKNLPARLKQYASFEYVQKTIKSYLKVRHVH